MLGYDLIIIYFLVLTTSAHIHPPGYTGKENVSTHISSMERNSTHKFRYLIRSAQIFSLKTRAWHIECKFTREYSKHI